MAQAIERHREAGELPTERPHRRRYNPQPLPPPALGVAAQDWLVVAPFVRAEFGEEALEGFRSAPREEIHDHAEGLRAMHRRKAARRADRRRGDAVARVIRQRRNGGSTAVEARPAERPRERHESSSRSSSRSGDSGDDPSEPEPERPRHIGHALRALLEKIAPVDVSSGWLLNLDLPTEEDADSRPCRGSGREVAPPRHAAPPSEVARLEAEHPLDLLWDRIGLEAHARMEALR
jgi:hypothetical protein